MSVDLLLYIFAFACFIAAAIQVQTRVNLVALGLALFVLTFIV